MATKDAIYLFMRAAAGHDASAPMTGTDRSRKHRFLWRLRKFKQHRYWLRPEMKPLMDKIHRSLCVVYDRITKDPEFLAEVRAGLVTVEAYAARYEATWRRKWRDHQLFIATLQDLLLTDDSFVEEISAAIAKRMKQLPVVPFSYNPAANNTKWHKTVQDSTGRHPMPENDTRH